MSRAFEVRQASSYEEYANFGEDVVKEKEIVERAKEFVKEMRELMSEQKGD